MPLPRFRRGRTVREPAVLIGDPRVEGWPTVHHVEDRETALAWRDQLRSFGVDAVATADYPLDRFGRGEIFLVVPPAQWSRANEIVDNID